MNKKIYKYIKTHQVINWELFDQLIDQIIVDGGGDPELAKRIAEEENTPVTPVDPTDPTDPTDPQDNDFIAIKFLPNLDDGNYGEGARGHFWVSEISAGDFDSSIFENISPETPLAFYLGQVNEPLKTTIDNDDFINFEMSEDSTGFPDEGQEGHFIHQTDPVTFMYMTDDEKFGLACLSITHYDEVHDKEIEGYVYLYLKVSTSTAETYTLNEMMRFSLIPYVQKYGNEVDDGYNGERKNRTWIIDMENYTGNPSVTETDDPIVFIAMSELETAVRTDFMESEEISNSNFFYEDPTETRVRGFFDDDQNLVFAMFQSVNEESCVYTPSIAYSEAPHLYLYVSSKDLVIGGLGEDKYYTYQLRPYTSAGNNYTWQSFDDVEKIGLPSGDDDDFRFYVGEPDAERLRSISKSSFKEWDYDSNQDEWYTMNDQINEVQYELSIDDEGYFILKTPLDAHTKNGEQEYSQICLYITSTDLINDEQEEEDDSVAIVGTAIVGESVVG